VAVWIYTWIRRGTLGAESAPPYLLQQGALVLMAVLGAVGAFASVVPGAPSRAGVGLLLALVMMMAALMWGTSLDLRQFGTAGIGREADWPCVVSITLGAVMLWMFAVALLRRGAVLDPRTTSVLAGVAALSTANIEACVSRIHAFTGTIILWHGTTAAIVLLGLTMFGPRLLGRRRGLAS